MKIKADSIVFQFDPICPRCGRSDENDSESTLQDISEAGWPICRSCDVELNYIDEATIQVEDTHNVLVVWAPGDVQTLRPDWTLDQCEEWLGANAKRIQDRSIELGWEVIECLLDMEEQ